MTTQELSTACTEAKACTYVKPTPQHFLSVISLKLVQSSKWFQVIVQSGLLPVLIPNQDPLLGPLLWPISKQVGSRQ